MDAEEIKRNTNFTPDQMRNFISALTNRKLVGMGIEFQKDCFKENNISFIVYFCLGKYSFCPDTFGKTLL